MDLVAFAKNMGQSAGFQDPADFDLDQPCDKETFSSAPCPDFWERLPSEIIDPNTGNSVSISQSFLKQFQKVIKGEICPKRFYYTGIAKTHEEEKGEGVNVRKLGNRFEYLVTGAPAYDGTYPGEVLTATGRVSKANELLEANAELAKETFAELGFDLNGAYAQIEVKVGILVAHMDLLLKKDGKVYVLDIKYSGLTTKSMRHSEFSWYPGTIHEKLGPKIQMRHYGFLLLDDGPARTISMPTPKGIIDLTEKIDLWEKPEDINAFVMVFDSDAKRSGQYIPYDISMSEDSINEHKNFILKMAKQIQRKIEGKAFDALPSYERCKKCPLFDTCEDYQQRPDIVSVQF